MSTKDEIEAKQEHEAGALLRDMRTARLPWQVTERSTVMEAEVGGLIWHLSRRPDYQVREYGMHRYVVHIWRGDQHLGSIEAHFLSTIENKIEDHASGMK